MSTIQSITAREILDSRGHPTLEATCVLGSGATATVGVPSGASTGTFEAHELRDNDKKRYGGKGVLTAVSNVNEEIAGALVGKEFDQRALDTALITLDGTPNKSRLGANAILGVSLSFAIAAAKEAGIPLYQYFGGLAGINTFTLPEPMFNVINGGKHADSGLDIQEYMIGAVGVKTMHEKIRVAAEVISHLKRILAAGGYVTSVGDEGGFAPKLPSNEEALRTLVQAIEAAGYTTNDVQIALDAAASSFYENGSYVFHAGGTTTARSSSELIEWYDSIRKEFPIISIEDGLAEEDWDGFRAMREKMGDSLQLVGDDLTVTNVEKIQIAIDKNAINAVLIKPNQIGSVSETVDAIMLTKKVGWKPFMSHRSGETVDTYISDFAVGLQCPFIKAGSLARGERIAKYNRLLAIANELA